MATAESLDDLQVHAPRQNRRDNLTMLQIDDLCEQLVNLGIVPIDDSVTIPEITDETPDPQVEVEDAAQGRWRVVQS